MNAKQKEALIAEALSGKGNTVKEIAKEGGVGASTLVRWVKRAREQRGPGDGMVTVDAKELARLRAKIARMERINEILKKAQVYFPKRSR